MRLIVGISSTWHYAIIHHNAGGNRVFCLSINTKLVAGTLIASAVLDWLHYSHGLNDRKASGSARTARRGCSRSNNVPMYACL